MLKTILQKITQTQKITSQTIQTFASIVGDYNPIHLNQQKAAQSIFGRRIAHGMIGVCYLQSMLPDNMKYEQYEVKFKKPIFVDQVIKMELCLYQEGNLFSYTVSKPMIGSGSSVPNAQIEKGQEKIIVVTQVTGKWKYL